MEVSYSTESGLFPVQEKIWNLFLYKLSDWALQNVEPIYTSLSNTDVFILDNGLEIFLWNGRDSFKQQQLKGKIICQRINRNERKGRARIFELGQGQDLGRFWDLLGGEFKSQILNDEWNGAVLYKYDKYNSLF